MTPPETDGDDVDQDVVDAIASLGNRQRLQILLALADRERELQEQGHSMTFTELYDAVDVDSTSQFSYHLHQLVGGFVVETETGYRLTYSGDRIARAIRSDLYESTPAFDDMEVDGTCVFCEDDTLVASLEDELFVVRCSSCDASLVTDFFPRSQSRHRSPSEIVSSFGYRIWSSVVLLRGDVCPECYGLVETTAETHDYGDQTFAMHVNTCRECGLVLTLPLEVTAVFHPAAQGFFWRHDVSLFSTPLWEFFEYVTSGLVETRISSLEPLEATVEVGIDDETIRLAVDDAGGVEPVGSE